MVYDGMNSTKRKLILYNTLANVHTYRDMDIHKTRTLSRGVYKRVARQASVCLFPHFKAPSIFMRHDSTMLPFLSRDI